MKRVLIVICLIVSFVGFSQAAQIPAWKMVVREGNPYLGPWDFLKKVTLSGEYHYHLGIDIISPAGKKIYPITVKSIFIMRL